MVDIDEFGNIADFPKNIEGHFKAMQADLLVYLFDKDTKSFYRVPDPRNYYDTAMSKRFLDEDHTPNPLGPTYRQAKETCKELGTEMTEEDFKEIPKLPGTMLKTGEKGYCEFRVASEE